MKNTAASIRARLKNLARSTGVTLPSLIERFVNIREDQIDGLAVGEQDLAGLRVDIGGHLGEEAAVLGLLLAGFGHRDGHPHLEGLAVDPFLDLRLEDDHGVGVALEFTRSADARGGGGFGPRGGFLGNELLQTGSGENAGEERWGFYCVGIGRELK